MAGLIKSLNITDAILSGFTVYMYLCLFSFRVLNLDKIGKSVSGDIHAKSHDASADRHALLWPLEFKGQIVRRLNDWCTAIPAVSVSCKIESVQVPTQHAYTGVRVVAKTV